MSNLADMDLRDVKCKLYNLTFKAGPSYTEEVCNRCRQILYYGTEIKTKPGDVEPEVKGFGGNLRNIQSYTRKGGI